MGPRRPLVRLLPIQSVTARSVNPRHAHERLEQLFADAFVKWIHGSSQCRKRMLTRTAGDEREYRCAVLNSAGKSTTASTDKNPQ